MNSSAFYDLSKRCETDSINFIYTLLLPCFFLFSFCMQIMSAKLSSLFRQKVQAICARSHVISLCLELGQIGVLNLLVAGVWFCWQRIVVCWLLAVVCWQGIVVIGVLRCDVIFTGTFLNRK